MFEALQNLPAESPYTPVARVMVYYSAATFFAVMFVAVLKVYDSIANYFNRRDVRDILFLMSAEAKLKESHQNQTERAAERVEEKAATIIRAVTGTAEELQRSLPPAVAKEVAKQSNGAGVREK